MATLSPIAWTPLPGEHLGDPLQWPEPQVVLVDPDGAPAYQLGEPAAFESVSEALAALDR
ncbi:hypothetical protein OHQ88_33985 (plasmid) [Micromonospora zamorensis]|uniref:hypothetical protein n=1 Tax=Micromonospora zamorensis TaxID=709883 RepID=UPI002E1DFC93